MKAYKTIEDLYNAVRNGEVEESNLRIILDNDNISFYDESLPEDEQDIAVKEANGYGDIEPLYRLVFPKANVEWC